MSRARRVERQSTWKDQEGTTKEVPLGPSLREELGIGKWQGMNVQEGSRQRG